MLCLTTVCLLTQSTLSQSIRKLQRMSSDLPVRKQTKTLQYNSNVILLLLHSVSFSMFHIEKLLFVQHRALFTLNNTVNNQVIML